MEIRKFSSEYVGDVAAIEKRCFSNPWNEITLAAELKNDCSHFHVAVLPGYRRRGAARALLLESFRENGANCIFLDVRESNTIAIKLYESLGFRDTGVRKSYYSNPTEDAVLMKWERNYTTEKTDEYSGY